MKTDRVLYENRDYVVSLINFGILVQSKRTQKGKVMTKKHPQYAEYLEAFDKPDEDEESALIRAFLN